MQYKMGVLATYQFWKENHGTTLGNRGKWKAKKYERTGPHEFVEFPYQEVTIPNIVKACNKHFEKRLRGTSIDVC